MKDPIPGAGAQAASPRSGGADLYLYAGVLAIVGVLGLLTGVTLALLGSVTSGAILVATGVVLLLAGFLMARRGR